ncbi:MAG: peptide chain release factor N(5)-glutamine methyltransferase [Planctomycetes bacterium]|nr:peptide chain release factor N(5)-glutamine methyltransferase [Planctomycetota bacterium]
MSLAESIPSRNEVWTVERLVTYTAGYFRQKGVAAFRLEAELLLANALGTDRVGIYGMWQAPVSMRERDVYRELVKRRGLGEPIAYILGRKEFYSLEFVVSRAVLIPRPETEIIVAETVKFIESIESPRLLDVGTGSGCIPVSVLKHNDRATFVAADVSDDALAVCRLNASKHEVDSRLRAISFDMMKPWREQLSDEVFDVIVSNPPYVALSEAHELQVDVKHFEPHEALFSGEDGLSMIRSVVDRAPDFIADGGHLLIEVGEKQSSRVIEYAGRKRAVVHERTINDLAGIPRCLVFRKV